MDMTPRERLEARLARMKTWIVAGASAALAAIVVAIATAGAGGSPEPAQPQATTTETQQPQQPSADGFAFEDDEPAQQDGFFGAPPDEGAPPVGRSGAS